MRLASSAVLALLALMVAGASAQSLLVGAGTPLGVANAAPVTEEAKQAAQFALEKLAFHPEFLGPANSQLQLQEITSVKTQVVAGVNYYLTLKVKTGSSVKEVEVLVWKRLGASGANGNPNFDFMTYKMVDNQS